MDLREPRDARLDKLPPRVLPLLYIGTAHVSLAFSLFCVAWWPAAVTGFFYHSWMVALVHLVTLGWITLSILGAIYIVGPLALRMPMAARRSDYVAYGLVLIGLIGMVAHFWIEEFGGMAWSAGTALTGIAYVMSRIVSALRTSKAPREVTLHIRLAAINFLAAATAGLLLACDKVYHFLPGYVLSNVFAHAHLAAIGWAVMMVVGVGYRLLPMVLPAAPPVGRSVALSAIFLETGVIVLFIGLVLRATWTPLGGLLIVSGLLVFVRHVIGMVRHPRPRPFGAVRPDFAVWHAMAAGLWLVVAMTIGVVLLFAPLSEWTLRAALAYGVLGLVGFLSQMILGLERRILPMHAWYWAFADTDFEAAVPPAHAAGSQMLRRLIFYFWLWGVPALALGLFIERPLMVGAGAWVLLAGVVLAAADATAVVMRLNSSSGRLPPKGRS